MPPKLAPPVFSPPLRRSARTISSTFTAATTTSSLDRDLHRQISDLTAEKQRLLNELARHEKQTEALRKDNEAKEERLRNVGEFLKVLERMDREQAKEEGWSVAEDEDGHGEEVVRVKRLQ